MFRDRLYLATKLANPHYRPEIAAQTTLVNFCVTEEGLEEQLLAAVVDHERADLQQAAAALVAQLGQYTITLTELENNLLARLANSQVWRATRLAGFLWVCVCCQCFINSKLTVLENNLLAHLVLTGWRAKRLASFLNLWVL